jgi:hypothetical protein
MEFQEVNSLIVADLKGRVVRARRFIVGYEVIAFFGAILYGYLAHADAISRSGDYGANVEAMPALIIKGILMACLGYPLGLAAIILMALLFFYPSLIAYKRGHAYKNIILVINLVFGFTGIGWALAMIWAIFPSEKSLIDPVVGNPTGLGRRNAGDTIGSAKQGSVRGADFEKKTDDLIDSLIDMRSKGLITDEEFSRKKREILQREY